MLVRAVLLKMRDIQITCKVGNECLNVCEPLEVIGRNPDRPLPSSAVA